MPLIISSNRHSMSLTNISIAFIYSGRFTNAKGGTEKIMCEMANELTDRGSRVSIFVQDKNYGHPGFPLNSNVKIFNVESIKLPTYLSKPIINLRALSLSKSVRHSQRFELECLQKSFKFSKLPPPIFIFPLMFLLLTYCQNLQTKTSPLSQPFTAAPQSTSHQKFKLP